MNEELPESKPQIEWPTREKLIEATRAEFERIKSQVDLLAKAYEKSLTVPGHTVSDENLLDSLELSERLTRDIKLARNLFESVEE